MEETAANDLGAQAAAVDKRFAHPLPREFLEVAAGFAEFDAAQDHLPADVELAAHEVIEGDAAREDVAPRFSGIEGEVAVAPHGFNRLGFDERDLGAGRDRLRLRRCFGKRAAAAGIAVAGQPGADPGLGLLDGPHRPGAALGDEDRLDASEKDRAGACDALIDGLSHDCVMIGRAATALHRRMWYTWRVGGGPPPTSNEGESIMLHRFTAFLGLIVLALATPVAPAQDTEPVRPRVDERERFDGHVVVRARPRSVRELQAVLALTPDVWSHGIGVGPLDVRIPPEAREALNATGIAYEVLIDDVQRLIDIEAQTAGREGGLDNEWFDDYKTYDQINTYLDTLAALRPDIARVFSVGTSIEGRAIKGLEITATAPGPGVRGVLYNGCQHAREWVASMATTYIGDQLIRQYGSDPAITQLVDSAILYVIPVVNPDGFVYTWTTNRMWRKNRRNNGNGTFGIDLNRNWSVEWGGVGSSGDPGSDLYRGTAPFSEPETAAMRDFLLERPWVERHVDIHSYSQYVLYPWAFTNQLTIEGAAFPNFAQTIANAIRGVHNVTYQPGQWYSRLYPSSGVMQDYTYAERAAWGFTFELRDTGQFGFVLPREQIRPTSEEIFAGAIALATANVEWRMLLEATGLRRGEAATLRAHRGQPGRPTYFIYTFAGYGSTYVPQLNVTLNLNQPALAGSAIADTDGTATLTRTVPNSAPRREILLQAAQQERRSNVVERVVE